MNLKLEDPKFHEEIFNEIGQLLQNFYDCLSDEDAENIDFIYAIASSENGWHTADVFFQKDNKIILKSELKDNNVDLQVYLMDKSNEMMYNLKQIFTTYNQVVPTQIKIIYNAITENLNYKFEYDLMWSETDGLLPKHLKDQWIDELKNSLLNNN